MSTHCYLQQVSPNVMEILQCYPCLVDVFQDAIVLKNYSDNYWRGIEKLQEERKSVDND